MLNSFELLWATDVHLDHLPLRQAAFEFGRALRQEQPSSRGVVLSGDIGEADTVEAILEDFAAGYGGPVYFVLGNHDYYGGSFRAVNERMASLSRRVDNLHWLSQNAVVLSGEVTLLGVEGWYDARHGDRNTDLELTDFTRIAELFSAQDDSRRSLLQTCAQRADADALRLDAELHDLGPTGHVIVATHVPPFREAAWHEGKPSNDRWAPFFSSKAMGDVLLAHAKRQPHRQHTVLCGHTHGKGVYRPLPNLDVYTGRARYGAPELAGIVAIHGDRVALRTDVS